MSPLLITAGALFSRRPLMMGSLPEDDAEELLKAEPFSWLFRSSDGGREFPPGGSWRFFPLSRIVRTGWLPLPLVPTLPGGAGTLDDVPPRPIPGDPARGAAEEAR